MYYDEKYLGGQGNLLCSRRYVVGTYMLSRQCIAFVLYG